MRLRKKKETNLRGKRKLSRDSLINFPHEIISAFSRLPRVFKRFDMDRILGNRISRGMKWRYLEKMEACGLIKHKTKKYYHKVYDKISDWIEKEVIPRIKRTEVSEKKVEG
ncbi:MAG: hypothetical protein QXG01_04090 [Candidatus Bathyarchaeia archaeon]